ncbi:MAG: SMP-30/gluconolactonase/LRE family protein [Gammaproteobacteria bacterium]|nr:SMP-30/gluconolactonase/LRE family protein [Gammaproteobacteria bacterium]
MSNDDDLILKVRHLSKTFDEHVALRDVSFDLKRADTLGVVGESGSGKTTLARCILRAIDPDRGGTVDFNSDQDGWVSLSSLRHKELVPLRKEMQMVFQDPYSSLNPRMTVRQIIEEPLVIHDEGNSAERLERVREMLDLVQLSQDSLTRYPHAFSGGQRQRIGIARALILNPNLVVCDETVSALDVSVQAQIINLLEDLQKTLHLTYIFVAHDLAVVRHICNNVLVMHNGVVVERGDVDYVFDHPQRNYTRLLLSAIPSPDPDVRMAPEDRTILEEPEPVANGYGLVEGPVWDDDYGLMFSDVIFGGVYSVNDSKEVEPVFEHRRGIGGMALHAEGGLVVSGKNVSLKRFGETKSILLLDRDPDNGNVGYNDLTTDTAGRIYVGSLGSSPVFDDGLEPRAGNLYVIDLDGRSRVVAEDVQLTNGLGFSPNGRVLYHSDSRRSQIYRYEVARNGDLKPREVFHEFENGAPDGLAVAEDGSIWVANAGAGGVAVIHPDGNQRAFISIPVPMCTSVCFGGAGLRTLYIVSGSNGVDGDRRGGVYRYEAPVSGLPVPVAKVEPIANLSS